MQETPRFDPKAEHASQPTGTQQLGVLAVALILTFLYAALFGFATRPIVLDNQQHFYMAERVASGGTPHTSNFEPKQTLSHLLAGAAIAAGRLVDLPDHISARVLSFFVLTAAAWLAWRLAFQLTGRWLTSLLCFGMLFSLSGLFFLGFLGPRPKVFMVVFVFASAFFLARQRHFLAGLSGSMAFLCWQPALMIVAAGVLVLVVHPADRNRRAVFTYTAAACLGVVVYESFYILKGALDEQIHQTLWFSSRYMAGSFDGLLHSLDELAHLWRRGFGRFNPVPVITFFGFIAAGCSLVSGRGRAFRILVTDRGWLFVTMCLVGTAAFTVYEHQGYADLLFPLPFMIVFSSLVLTAVIDGARYAGRWVVVIVFAFLAILPADRVARWSKPPFTLQDQIRSGEEVLRMLDEGETVYATGCTHLLAFAHTENWVKYGVSFRQLDRYLADTSHPETWVPEKNGEKPTIVLLSRRPPRGIKSWLRMYYVEVVAPDFERQDVGVYRLRREVKPGSDR